MVLLFERAHRIYQTKQSMFRLISHCYFVSTESWYFLTTNILSFVSDYYKNERSILLVMQDTRRSIAQYSIQYPTSIPFSFIVTTITDGGIVYNIIFILVSTDVHQAQVRHKLPILSCVIVSMIASQQNYVMLPSWKTCGASSDEHIMVKETRIT